MAQSRPRKRTGLFAAFTSGGEPVMNVFDFDRSKLETLLADRKATGTGFPGEHIVNCTVVFYRDQLRKQGFPVPAALERPEPPVAVEAFQLSLSRDDVSHLLHALDASIADIEARAAEPGESSELGSALLSANRGLRARVAALLVPVELQQ